MDKKNLEIQQLQLTSTQTLEGVRETDKVLKAELSKLRQEREVDPIMLWRHSDWRLRAIYTGIVLLTILTVGVGVRVFFR